MGYSTDFEGSFELNKLADDELVNIMNILSGDIHDDEETPGTWCQWELKNRSTIEWDQNEKFYSYVEWLDYIINKILIPRGYVLNGDVTWYGEDNGDTGNILVQDNKISVGEVPRGEYVYEDYKSEYTHEEPKGDFEL